MRTGRPKAEINFKLLDAHLRAQCSGAAIAGLMGIHPDTLYKAVEAEFKMTFSAYSQQKKAEGCEILRKSMFDFATSRDRGSVPMAIFLAKNYLGMTDRTELKADLSMDNLSDADINRIVDKMLNTNRDEKES